MTRARVEVAVLFAILACISISATVAVKHAGWTLYYGDAESHLNIARRIVDSRTPGYDQIGTVWLPLPHLLALPLVGDDRLWRNGLAGAIPSSLCFVVAGLFLFAAMRRATQSSSAALASAGLLALNPNLLYLQSTPMTEPVFLAGFMALLYCTVLFRESQSFGAVAGAGVASLIASMSRYEGWFLIPFVALYFLCTSRRRMRAVLIFGLIASLGPLYWFAHNWWLYGNPLEFFNGPYSTQNINRDYPGLHDWKKSWLFFRTAARMCVGWGAVGVAAAGVVAVCARRLWWPVALAALLPIFYLWTMHSGGTPIFVPQLWFGSYYNTRYGLAALPVLAIAGGSLALLAGQRWRPLAAVAVVFIATMPWLIRPQRDNWVCWKESQVNSEARRGWTREAAMLMTKQYRPGTGILTGFGDLTGILREAGIPLREALNDCNEPAWMAATTRPGLFLHEEWAVAISGDPVANAVRKTASEPRPRYYLVRTILTKGAPTIEIYKRN